MRVEIEQLKISEGKLKDDLIVSLRTAALSKDVHIKDLQTINAELQNANSVFKQVVESVNSELHQLKTLLKETFEKQHTKFENHLETLTKNFLGNTAQVEDKSLKSCKLKLNETQIQLQLKNISIAENTAKISQLSAIILSKEETITKCETRIEEYEVMLTKQNESIQQYEQEVAYLKEQIKQNENEPNRCITCGDTNGIYNVKLPDFDGFTVLCDSELAGLGWLVIEQRINGEENFTRDWETYKNGFGSYSGDFFLGLEKIYRLTSDQPHELYVHMEEWFGKTLYARYDNFSIAGEEDKYRLLSVGSFSGNARDGLRYHVNQQFSTYDNDNDACGINCADGTGGWWYKNCWGWQVFNLFKHYSICSNEFSVYFSNVHGKYFKEEVRGELNVCFWTPFRQLRRITLMIRPLSY